MHGDGGSKGDDDAADELTNCHDDGSKHDIEKYRGRHNYLKQECGDITKYSYTELVIYVYISYTLYTFLPCAHTEHCLKL